MNTLNYNNPKSITDETYVGVDRNRLVVTTRSRDFGTFAVTTNGDYHTLPFRKANIFRINNYTGKTVGIRRRHNKIVVDNFNDTKFSEWSGSGTIDVAQGLEGTGGAEVNGLVYRALTTEVLNDGSEVEITFVTPSEDTYSVKLNVWDNVSRIGVGTATATFEATESNTIPSTQYKITFRFDKSNSTSVAYIEHEGDRTAQPTHSGEFGTNDMQDSVVSIESNGTTVVDPIIYQQKVNQTHELMFNASSFTYPCEDNIAEYEIINMGSDVMNYSDNTVTISLSGFYAS